MGRHNFFYFTIEGDDLDPIILKEVIGLPCETYYKGQKTLVYGKKEVESVSTRWVYEAIVEDKTKKHKRTIIFLVKHLSVIAEKLPILKDYINKYDATIDLVIYDDDKDNNILLDTNIINLLSKIGAKFSITFH